MLTVATIVDRARGLLLDSDKSTWSDADLAGYVSEGQRQTCFVKPDAYVTNGPMALVAGTFQTIPSDGVALFDVVSNAADGSIITQVDKELLDANNRAWRGAAGSAVIEHYTADPRSPRYFSVSPPALAGTTVNIVYGAVPPVCTYADNIALPDSYEAALRVYCMAVAYQKNTKRQDLAKSQMLMNDWRMSLGQKAQAQIAVAPAVSAQPGV